MFGVDININKHDLHDSVVVNVGMMQLCQQCLALTSTLMPDEPNVRHVRGGLDKVERGQGGVLADAPGAFDQSSQPLPSPIILLLLLLQEC